MKTFHFALTLCLLSLISAESSQNSVDTTVWSNMKGFDSVCSKSEYSINIRVDQTFYALHDDDYVTQDCNTLCGSVGSFCMAAWEECPVAGESTNNYGCSNTNSDTFVCSCVDITSSGFFLIDGAPGRSADVGEISNPDFYDDRGEVQCCNSRRGSCTRHDPWNSSRDRRCMSGNRDEVKYSLFEAISMCEALGDDWSLCTREEVNSGICGGKGCGHNHQYVWAWDPNAILASSKVINYEECITINSRSGPHHEFEPENWNTKCPENTAVVSVETKDLEAHNGRSWTIVKMQCCALVDKITQSHYRLPEMHFIEGKPNYLQGGGSSSVEDQWEAQCASNAIMVGIYDNDDSGDFDDIDAAKCNTLECSYTCGEKIDDHDCVVIDLSPASLSSCPIDYVMVGLWDHADSNFDRVRKMKCCRVLESILPTVSPTQMPTTDEPSECPTVSPTTSIPSMSPTTNDPTIAPSTDTPTKSPSQNPTTEEPSAFPTKFPTYAPTLCEPTCRSHADQLVNVLGRLLDFNTQLLRDFEPNHPLKNALNEMIFDVERLKDQMNNVHDDMSIFPLVH